MPMNGYERQIFIEELREDCDANRAEIERKRLARESDPIAYDDYIRSADPVQDVGLIFKDHDNTAHGPHLPEPEPPITREEISKAFDASADGVGELIALERQRERKELAEKLAPILERLTRIEGALDVLKSNAEQAIHDGEKARNASVLKFVQEERAERSNAIAALKADMSQLYGRLEILKGVVAAGMGELVSLPRRFWNKWDE